MPTSRHRKERYSEKLAIIKAESEIDKAMILAKDDDQLLSDVVEEHLSLVQGRRQGEGQGGALAPPGN